MVSSQIRTAQSGHDLLIRALIEVGARVQILDVLRVINERLRVSPPAAAGLALTSIVTTRVFSGASKFVTAAGCGVRTAPRPRAKPSVSDTGPGSGFFGSKASPGVSRPGNAVGLDKANPLSTPSATVPGAAIRARSSAPEPGSALFSALTMFWIATSVLPIPLSTGPTAAFNDLASTTLRNRRHVGAQQLQRCADDGDHSGHECHVCADEGDDRQVEVAFRCLADRCFDSGGGILQKRRQARAGERAEGFEIIDEQLNVARWVV